MRATLKPLWQRWLARRIPPAASVRLNQRRILILPSRVGGAFAVALLLMLLLGTPYVRAGGLGSAMAGQVPRRAGWRVLLAVALASVNIFGGFLVTQRMLAMYKKKER